MMKHAALLTLISLALSCPVIAKPHHVRHHHYAARKSHHADHYPAHASHSGITCDMVRAYVAKVGLGQAIAMAKSAGISAGEEERARQCLAKKI